jgi:hypothetical protein
MWWRPMPCTSCNVMPVLTSRHLGHCGAYGSQINMPKDHLQTLKQQTTMQSQQGCEETTGGACAAAVCTRVCRALPATPAVSSCC